MLPEPEIPASQLRGDPVLPPVFPSSRCGPQVRLQLFYSELGIDSFFLVPISPIDGFLRPIIDSLIVGLLSPIVESQKKLPV